jgi:hypothetical protein
VLTAFDIRKGDVKARSTISNNNSNHNNDDNNDKHIIQKPILMDDLVNRVRAELS